MTARITITDYRLDEFGLWITCPGCKLRGRADHTVEPSGEVNPSLDCPDPDCDFHAMVKLENWPHGRVDATAKPKRKS